MRLIPYYDYSYSPTDNAMETLHEIASCGMDAILCRIRMSRDRVLFVHHETTMARLCLCDEQVSELRFSEIDALMQLCGYHVLTLERLFAEYTCSTKLILHFRGFRPDASVVSRVVRDGRFSFGSDSMEQIRVIADGYPNHQITGFASHIPTAVQLAEQGVQTVCLHGRELQGYTCEQLAEVSRRAQLWIELPGGRETSYGESVALAEKMGISGMILPFTSFQ